MIASKQVQEYFEELKKEALKEYKLASEAKKKGYDPEDFVEVKLAENLAERVIGLISAVAPQLSESGAIKRIIELEEIYSPLDWRVALKIALEIAQEKFCTFKNKTEAMEVGIRTGFAYVTLGVVSAPLEGFTTLEIKDRLDGKGKYFCINFSGPIRAAGGTAAAVSVIIADYVRKQLGYQEYDPTEKEVQRCHAELEDYHEYVTNLQYFPSKAETEFLLRHLPVEISGDPSEKFNISSALLRDLPRVPTNKLRSGYCLIHSSCIPLKGPKLWAKIRTWGPEMDMKHWAFMEEFLKIQTKMKSKSTKKEVTGKLAPDFTYITDLVGGRPVLGHPLRSGGLRLRYGRSRTSGFSAQSVHPATMILSNNFIATGTQLKVERPGKAAAYSCCDTIDGPIIKLKNGDVVYVDNEIDAKKYKDDVQEIIYFGDVLINYGDFYDRAHKLVPAGYCQEIWIQELEEAAINLFWTIDPEKISDLVSIDPEKITTLLKNPLKTKISFTAALEISKMLNISLHPSHLYYWNTINVADLKELRVWIKTGKIEDNKIILNLKEKQKRFLELIGVPHKQINNEFVVIENEHAEALNYVFQLKKDDSLFEQMLSKHEKPSDVLTELSGVEIRDKSGTFIGARMGRPEKAKMRKLTGSPHALFPVGEEGGRLRSFQSAMDVKRITAEIQLFKCKKCSNITPFKICEKCDSKTDLVKYCPQCGESTTCEHEVPKYKKTEIKIVEIIENLKRKLNTKILPDLIKGVRGTANKEHMSEHLMKGILRAKHNLSVNKDGTIRYDCSEVSLTHFKPKEINVPVKKLIELGYKKDIYGFPLEKDDQILELKVQDIVLPCSTVSPDEASDEVLFRTANFIDEELEKLYGLKPFYNLKSKEDLVGHLTIGLAPHTSAGIVTRIVGFSKTQAFFAHPYIHAAMRRDCDGDESCILLLMDAYLNFSKQYLPSSRGSTMDAPLVLTSVVLPAEVDDMVFNVDLAYKYPLALYRAADQYKMPYDVKMKRIGNVIGTEAQYENFGFTHDTTNINAGVLCSSYKLLPSMGDKVQAQMDIAVKLRAVDQSDVARLIIEKHFIRDTKGNLRKFSTQEFRCVHCNEKYRRPPLMGKCNQCGGKIIFTISEGSIVKYMEYSMMLAEKYHVSSYIKQTLELTQRRIEGVFGRDKEVQTGLSSFMEEQES
ncbi:DNA polymerase II large subunit [Candidatus Woesearchaeota archaeon CG10_big_fil_rev_8_21_14_0_10_32_9]|nr:MAG: DNA polymerase II large subunit [Candidatus Woesearchaeota archaeon CG10_big_fil_rev_8_21_14_0_10_32_9]